MATPPSPPAAPNRLTDTDTEFVTKADAMMDWFADDLATEFEAFGDEVVTEAADWFRANSTTSVAIGSGTKSFTIEVAKAFQAGQYVSAHDAADPTTNYMIGQVTSYNAGTGALVISVGAATTYGSGTKTDWDIYLSGPQGPAGSLPSRTGNAGKVLAVNAGESAEEWVEDGWEQIGATLSPSGAASASFTAIPTTYSDLLVIFSLSSSSTGALRPEISPDSSTWAQGQAITGSTTSTRYGAIHVPGYNYDYGVMYGAGGTNASPNTTTGVAYPFNWAITGGIDGLRIVSSGGNITGTVKLYGRR